MNYREELNSISMQLISEAFFSLIHDHLDLFSKPFKNDDVNHQPTIVKEKNK